MFPYVNTTYQYNDEGVRTSKIISTRQHDLQVQRRGHPRRQDLQMIGFLGEMTMKHTTFASPALVMYSMIPPAILFLVPFMISCVSLRVQNILMIISAFISMSAIISMILRHAFVLVSYGQHGIATRHLSLAFEDIHYATTIDVEILKYCLLPTITMK